ncbi:MAG TPA: murein transglycosylase A [Stellaceae bacterium]|nr:murein transglycosylase A [Stellaceae bacterium]
MAERRLRRDAATAAGLLLFFLLSACAPKAPPPPHLALTRVAFSDLPGWRNGDQAAALSALLRSCATLAKLPDDASLGVAGLARDWRKPCATAATLDHPTDDAARRFFESAFTPFAMTDNGKSDALVTGYYEPEIVAARQKSARFGVPILARPPDLVGVSLGDFRPSWRGERIAGRVVDGKLVPYWTRAEIEGGTLDRFRLALFYAADPIDLFFLQIQGSGRVRLPDGRTVEIGYDGENGRAYVALGRLLVERGAMTLDHVSMQSIEAWLRAHPADAKTLMDENPSYVFFRVLAGGAPLGAEGVDLTPQHSVAVDPRFVPLGTPLWLDVAQDGAATRRLAVAQDTGAAIKGPLRADLFCGAGPAAAAQAGPLRASGRMFLLLPQIGVTQG